jgi:orotidine-5'-phosphate decarboxylase
LFSLDLNEVVYRLASAATLAGCDAVTVSGSQLEDERIRSLPIKKLVTAIRIDPKDLGTQFRVTLLDQLSQIRNEVDYVVVSSRYLEDPNILRAYITKLRK